MDWINLQRTQRALLHYTHNLPGTRVLVYGLNTTMQWINGMVTGQDKKGKLTILNEQVLTPITIDPRTTQTIFLNPHNILDVIHNNKGRSCRSSASTITSTNERSQRTRRLAKRKSCPEISNYTCKSKLHLVV
ncbi:putative JmjC domain-containing histone demethylation protein 2C [Ciona intestinalis]